MADGATGRTLPTAYEEETAGAANEDVTGMDNALRAA
jgi:hypothetical protein